MSISLPNYLQTISHYQQATPLIKKRLLTPEQVLNQFGSLPHLEANKGFEIPTDSQKRIVSFDLSGQKLILKDWKKADEESKLALVLELLGRRFATEISDRGNKLYTSKIFIPGGIGYEADGSVFLVTNEASGEYIDTLNVTTLPIDLRAKIISTILFSSVKEFFSSSILIDNRKKNLTASLIDWESIKFNKNDFLPTDATLVLTSMLMKASIYENLGKKFAEELETTGKDWIGLLRKDEYKNYLSTVIKEEIGEPPLGDTTLSADEIVNYLLESAEFYESYDSFNLWHEETSNTKMPNYTDLSDELLKEVAKEYVKQAKDEFKPLLEKLLARIESNEIHLEPNFYKEVTRIGHSLKPVKRYFNDPMFDRLFEAAVKVEKLGSKKAAPDQLKIAINELIYELDIGLQYLEEKYLK